MNSHPQPRHHPLRSSAQGPLLALAAILSLGMGGGKTPCPARPVQAARPKPATAPAPVHFRTPSLASSWMDFVDFRRGSGDALTNLRGPALAAAAARPRHLTPDS